MIGGFLKGFVGWAMQGAAVLLVVLGFVWGFSVFWLGAAAVLFVVGSYLRYVSRQTVKPTQVVHVVQQPNAPSKSDGV